MSSKDNDNELNEFIEELDSAIEDTSSLFGESDDDSYKELEPISEEEFENKLMSGVAMLLDSCNEVAHALKTRIKAGDNYEGTMMGFAQATDNTIKTLKILDNRRTLKLKETIENKKIELTHKKRLELEEKKNEGRAMSGVKNITQNNNTFVGSPEEFFKQMKTLETGVVEETENDVIDVD